jgi:hypothetical protein
MKKTVVAEGIVDILLHPFAVGPETPQLEGIRIAKLPQHVQVIAPVEIVQLQLGRFSHAHHLVTHVEQNYIYLTISTLI